MTRFTACTLHPAAQAACAASSHADTSLIITADAALFASIFAARIILLPAVLPLRRNMTKVPAPAAA